MSERYRRAFGIENIGVALRLLRFKGNSFHLKYRGDIINQNTTELKARLHNAITQAKGSRHYTPSYGL